MIKKIINYAIFVILASVFAIVGYTIYKINKPIVEVPVDKTEDSDFDYVFESKDKKSKSAVVVKDLKRGYISKETGEVIFEPQFKFAWVDNGVNDLAACVNEEDKLGFVNIKTKEIAIPFQFDYDAIELNSYIYGYQWNFANCNFDFVFSNGWCLVPGEGGKLGLINESGEIVLPIKYYNIINWKDKNSPNIILVTKKEGEEKYIYEICDRNFKKVSPHNYENISKVISYTDDGMINCKGYMVCQNSKWGIIDSSYNQVVPYKYDEIKGVEDNDNAFIVKKGAKYGVINFMGEVIIPIKYDLIETDYDYYRFREILRYYVVQNYIPMLFDEKGVLLNDFYMRKPRPYVQSSGFKVLPEPFDKGASEYIQYSLYGLKGVVDGNKRVIIPPKYTEIEYLGHGNFSCFFCDEQYLIHVNK